LKNKFSEINPSITSLKPIANAENEGVSNPMAATGMAMRL
jgi:hypothetical protein